MYKAFFSVAYRCGLGLILLSANSATADTIKLRLSDSLSKLMTEIRYEEHEPGEPAYLSRFLVLDERVRIDFGRDDEGFILFDRQANSLWALSFVVLILQSAMIRQQYMDHEEVNNLN